MKTCRKDFQGRKSTTVLKLLCRNIAAGRFNWRRYCTPQTYFGQEICVTPLHCSYGQIGYTVHFPYSNMPEVEYDWEMGKLTIDEANESTSFSPPVMNNVSPLAGSCSQAEAIVFAEVATIQKSYFRKRTVDFYMPFSQIAEYRFLFR